MSGRRWIVRDTKCGDSQPFLGTRGWGFTVAAAGSYERREDADNALGSLAGCAPGRLVVRRVVPAGTKRARADAQAAEDNVATMRAELEGLRATDEEMAAKLAQAQVEVAAAERRAKDIEARCASWESAYTLARRREEVMCDALGVQNGECIDEVAKRVVRERDEARKALAPPLPHVAFLQRLSDATGIEVASDDFEVRVLTFVHDLASMRSEILDIAARTPRAVTVKASPC